MAPDHDRLTLVALVAVAVRVVGAVGGVVSVGGGVGVPEVEPSELSIVPLSNLLLVQTLPDADISNAVILP